MKSSTGSFHVQSLQDASHPMTKSQILKNVLVLSIGFLVLFTAYDGLAMLQSTMNREKGVGVISQAVLYFCFCTSALVLPKYVIKRLGSKLTLVLSMLTYIPYVASNFYPHWSVMIPTSVMIGFGAALLWGSLANYLNDVSVLYAERLLQESAEVKDDEKFEVSKKEFYTIHDQSNGKDIELNLRDSISELQCFKSSKSMDLNQIPLFDSGKNMDPIKKNTFDSSTENMNPNQAPIFDSGKDIDPNRNNSIFESTNIRQRKVIESTTARFFGFHGMAFLTSVIWSNLLSYFLMQGDSSTFHSTCACGANFCDTDSCFKQRAPQMLSDNTRYVLTGVCVCLGLVSVLVVGLLLDPLNDKSGDERFSLHLLTATVRLAKKTELILLMPMSLYLGMSQAFFSGDFTKSFISCAWGTHNVGLVAAFYGASCALSSFLSGWGVRRVGRTPVFSAAALLNVASCVLLLTWAPDSERPVIFFVAAGMWGLYVGITFSQIRALYGVLFKAEEEAAFATFYTWYSLGFFISFAYSNFICTCVKLYLLLTVSTAGFIGYLVVERRHANNNNIHQ